MSRLYDWLEERLEVQSIGDDILSKHVPAHVNLFYCIGGMVLCSFLIQGASGFLLTIYYKPSIILAYNSIVNIIYSVYLGWVIRSIHRWSAGLMVLALLGHVYRVFLTGGFKQPRELTWLSGSLLAVCTVSFGVTGYSLPWDQIGYWACKIVTATPEVLDEVVLEISSTFLVGLRGSISVGQLTLTRFYSIHTLLLPVLTLLLMLVHFLLIRKQGISGPA